MIGFVQNGFHQVLIDFIRLVIANTARDLLLTDHIMFAGLID